MTYFPNISTAVETLRTAGKEIINESGSTLTKALPVYITTLGVAAIDVSNEDQVSAIAGLVKEQITIGSSGEIVSAGIIEDFTTAFSVGDVVYIGKTPGSLTNTKPSIGIEGFIAGDWIVRLGVVAKNINDALKKDLLVSIQIIGQI